APKSAAPAKPRTKAAHRAGARRNQDRIMSFTSPPAAPRPLRRRGAMDRVETPVAERGRRSLRYFTVTTEFLLPNPSSLDSGFASSCFQVVPLITNLYP